MPTVCENYDTVTSASRDVEEEHDRKLKKLQRDISDAQFKCATITRQKETLQSELDAARQEAAGLRSTVASLSAAQEGVRAELASVKVTWLILLYFYELAFSIYYVDFHHTVIQLTSEPHPR